MVAYLGLWAFGAIAWYLTARFTGLDPHAPLGLAAKSICWLVPMAVFARVKLGESPLRAFGFVAPNAGGLLRGIGAVAAYLAITQGLQRLVFGGVGPLELRPGHVAAVTANAFVEEAAFRGFLLLHWMRDRRPWHANALVSLLFAAVHVPFALHAASGIAPAVAIILTTIFVMSFAFGYATTSTRSVWIAGIAHAINNVLAGS